MNEYKPIVVKAEKGIFSKGGSYNANQFLDNKEEELKAEYEYDFLGTNAFAGSYKEKTSPLSFEILKNLSTKVAPISAIINTRINQVGAFTSQSRYKNNGVGFSIKSKDPDKEIDDETQKKILELERFILNCGFSKSKKRDSFDTFIRKITRDSLTLDQVNFEIVRDEDGKPFEFYAVDASTIRAATEEYQPKDDGLDESKENEEVEYIQLVDGKVVAWFTDDELAFAIRNPRTDIGMQPYGLSEIETITKQLASYLEAEDYNMRFFQQGGMTKGILNIKEDPNGISGARGLESFKRQWRTQVTGQQGAWKIPVLQLPGELEFINIQQSGGEMVFEKWVNYLINISCAVYQIDPAEINFPNNGGAGGKGNSLFQGQSDKINASKDKGLIPLLQFIQNTINKFLISDFSDEFTFVFEGLDIEDESKKLQIDRDEVNTYKTVNEKRIEKGMDTIEGGDVILNPYYMQSTLSSGGSSDFDIFDDEEDEYNDSEDYDNDSEDIFEDYKGDITVSNMPVAKSILFKIEK